MGRDDIDATGQGEFTGRPRAQAKQNFPNGHVTSLPPWYECEDTNTLIVLTSMEMKLKSEKHFPPRFHQVL